MTTEQENRLREIDSRLEELDAKILVISETEEVLFVSKNGDITTLNERDSYKNYSLVEMLSTRYEFSLQKEVNFLLREKIEILSS